MAPGARGAAASSSATAACCSSTGRAYDDWSLPKGKLEPGESWETAALREVEEETGLRCELGEEVGRTYYVDCQGRARRCGTTA